MAFVSNEYGDPLFLAFLKALGLEIISWNVHWNHCSLTFWHVRLNMRARKTPNVMCTMKLSFSDNIDENSSKIRPPCLEKRLEEEKAIKAEQAWRMKRTFHSPYALWNNCFSEEPDQNAVTRGPIAKWRFDATPMWTGQQIMEIKEIYRLKLSSWYQLYRSFDVTSLTWHTCWAVEIIVRRLVTSDNVCTAPAERQQITAIRLAFLRRQSWKQQVAAEATYSTELFDDFLLAVHSPFFNISLSILIELRKNSLRAMARLGPVNSAKKYAKTMKTAKKNTRQVQKSFFKDIAK